MRFIAFEPVTDGLLVIVWRSQRMFFVGSYFFSINEHRNLNGILFEHFPVLVLKRFSFRCVRCKAGYRLVMNGGYVINSFGHILFLKVNSSLAGTKLAI